MVEGKVFMRETALTSQQLRSIHQVQKEAAGQFSHVICGRRKTFESKPKTV